MNIEVVDNKLMFQGLELKRGNADLRTVTDKKNLCINELLMNLNRRFPADHMSTISSLHTVLSPSVLKPLTADSVATHGTAQLNSLCEFFEAAPAELGFQADRAKHDFLAYKMFARLTPHVSLLPFAQSLLTQYPDDYPDFSLLMHYFLTVPLNSASCERGFSRQNIIKTKTRNRLTEERLTDLMRVSINGPHLARFDYYGDAAANFRAMKDRRH